SRKPEEILYELAAENLQEKLSLAQPPWPDVLQSLAQMADYDAHAPELPAKAQEVLTKFKSACDAAPGAFPALSDYVHNFDVDRPIGGLLAEQTRTEVLNPLRRRKAEEDIQAALREERANQAVALAARWDAWDDSGPGQALLCREARRLLAEDPAQSKDLGA